MDEARHSLTGAQWRLLPVSPGKVDALVAGGLSAVVARCLALRWDEPGDLSWLRPSIEHLHDPGAMFDMDRATERLWRAVRQRERVRIITDYDVDGTTSSLILQAVLRLCGMEQGLDYHIPSRFGEGYGLSVAAVEAAADDGVRLVVAADIGVRDHEAVARARERGLDVLVCDHHLPDGERVPDDAIVLCPPRAECSYPNPHLAACGVSLKVAQAMLGERDGVQRLVRSLLKLAALGTVADMVPLVTAENRAIVALGLRELNRGPHQAGLAALVEASELKVGSITTRDLGFRIGPRINAAGRMAGAGLVVELLNCREPRRARALARELDELNRRRQTTQRRQVAAALRQVGEEPDPFVVVGGPEEQGWHRGVVGIVAARVKDETHRPAAVFSMQGELVVGSVRSVPGIHAVQALGSVSDLLLRFGGHPAAAGFTLRAEDLGAFRERLARYVTQQRTVEELVPVRDVDVEVGAAELDESLRRDLEVLGPFGSGNPRPRLAVCGVRPRNVEVRGARGRLLRFLVPRPGRGAIEAVWWGQGERAAVLSEAEVDLLGDLRLHAWAGRRRLQLQLTDARLAG